ncbi:hypothetical protein AB0L00_23325 [Actinoallomurus sp. NPDC052308]|uniref:hypothetical protein n=1 Tax=Actinoallomurus sp. NPDC052308 TaxID=3155530 RepID=UPI00341D7A66
MPQDPSAWYDFTAAETLAAALRKAAGNVTGLAGTRGAKLISELGCWVGTGYERWKDDFNKQQSQLCDDANQLNAYAAQIDNASAQAREVKNGTPAQTTSPGPPADAPRANSHPGQPGQQSAVPENLYAYAKATTDENDKVKPQINGALLNAVNGYFTIPAGAYHPLTATIPDLYTGGSSPFITRLSGLLTTVRTTDAHVHDVGKTFEDASTGSNSTWPPGVLDEFHRRGIDPRSVATVTLDDASFDKDLAATISEEAGTDLATKFNKEGATSELLEELAKHVNDPAFMAAFLNGLDEVTLKTLLVKPYPKGTAPGTTGFKSYEQQLLQGILAAVSSGDLSPQACNWIVDEMGLVDLSYFNEHFFDGLQKDPKSAVTFFESLDSEHLQKLLNGGFSLRNSNRDQRQELIFDILLKGVQTLHTPAEVAGLLDKVGTAMDGVTSDHPQDVQKAVSDFVSQCVIQIITAPSSSADMDYLTLWGEGYGSEFGEMLQPFLKWMKSSDQKIADNQALVQSIIENIVIGVTTSLLPSPSTPVLAKVSYAAISSALAAWLQSAAHPNIPYDQIPIIGGLFTAPNANADAVALAYVAEQTAEFQMVVSLIQTGQVVGPNGPVDLSSSQNIIDVLNNPLKYHLNGQSIEDVLNGFRSRYKDQVLNTVTQ